MVSNTKKEKSSKQQKHRNDHHRVEKVRERERERRSSLNDERSQSPTPKKSNSTETSDDTREGTERASLSIEETNKLRVSLGLKPLTIDNNLDASKKSLNSDENFVHRPPENLTDKKQTEEITRKINERKEARALQAKFLETSTIASESAASWIEKMRQTNEEKRKAAERAKLLEQMDEEFRVSTLINEESEKRKQKKYAPKDLTGLRIEHSIDEFKEGQQVILTLKDKKILRDEKDDNDEAEDVLINVNIADNEVAKQRIDLGKKKRPGYRAYDDDESADQFGMFNSNKILDQYDEKKKSSFRLQSGGTYDMSDEKLNDNTKQEIRTKMQSLALPTPQVASDFYTATEMELFKKPKKAVTKKKLRSRQMLQADDLLPMDSNEPQESSTSVFLRPAEVRRPTAITSASKDRPTTVSLDKIKRTLITTTTAAEDDDYLGPDDDLSNVPIEDDAFDELQAVVNKTMKLKIKKGHISGERALDELIEERDRKIKVEIKSESMETGIILPSGPVPPDDKNIVLDTMSEFCRNVGENAIDSISTVPKLRASAKLKRTNIQSSKKSTSKTNVSLDPDDELLQHALENEDLDDDVMDDTPADDINTKPFRLEDSILSSEPTLDRGLGSALQLALQKGYIKQDKNRQNARFVSDISAKHITIEEKNAYEIEDKHARRDRYTSGPTTEFKEKDNYRPDIKLEYVDDSGRRINEKEAFRRLSYRFHGKASGKTKTEKRVKKQVEEETPPVPPPATTVSAIIEENTENDWADFESNTVPYSEQPIPPSNEQQTNEIVKQKEDDDDDDFG